MPYIATFSFSTWMYLDNDRVYHCSFVTRKRGLPRHGRHVPCMGDPLTKVCISQTHEWDKVGRHDCWSTPTPPPPLQQDGACLSHLWRSDAATTTRQDMYDVHLWGPHAHEGGEVSGTDAGILSSPPQRH